MTMQSGLASELPSVTNHNSLCFEPISTPSHSAMLAACGEKFSG